MKRIWLNHWFSTAYFIINMMRENNPEFQFIASNENQDSPIMKASDEWYQEPVLKGKEYVDFCLGFLRKAQHRCVHAKTRDGRDQQVQETI